MDTDAPLWTHLAAPFHPAVGIEALLGLPRTQAVELARLLVSTSDEARSLLAAVPTMLAGIKSSVELVERPPGVDVNGPVNWGLSVMLQAHGPHRELFHVTSEARRTFSTPRNQALVAALTVVAGGTNSSVSGSRPELAALAVEAGRLGSAALRARRHPALRRVPTPPPRPLNHRRPDSDEPPEVHALFRMARWPLPGRNLVGIADRATLRHLQMANRVLDLIAAPADLRRPPGDLPTLAGGLVVRNRTVTGTLRRTDGSTLDVRFVHPEVGRREGITGGVHLGEHVLADHLTAQEPTRSRSEARSLTDVDRWVRSVLASG